MSSMRGGHRHVPLTEGRASAAAIYANDFCEALAKAIQVQKANDNTKSVNFVHSVDLHAEDGSDCWAIDDVTGMELDKEKVRQAREEELRIAQEMNLYQKMTMAEARATGA